jgi:hypothetical protein
MEKVYDEHAGATGLRLTDKSWELTRPEAGK